MLSEDASWAKQVWWELSVLKRNKLKIKTGENKKSINKSYLYLFITTHASTYTDYILNWMCFADLPVNIPTNIKNVGILKDIDQKN